MLNPKSWARYNRALENLSEQKNNNRRDMVSSLLHMESDKQAIESATNGKDASALKDEGNFAFKNKLYDKAAELYTSALMMHGETSRALLSNWALAAFATVRALMHSQLLLHRCEFDLRPRLLLVLLKVCCALGKLNYVKLY